MSQHASFAAQPSVTALGYHGAHGYFPSETADARTACPGTNHAHACRSTNIGRRRRQAGKSPGGSHPRTLLADPDRSGASARIPYSYHGGRRPHSDRIRARPGQNHRRADPGNLGVRHIQTHPMHARPHAVRYRGHAGLRLRHAEIHHAGRPDPRQLRTAGRNQPFQRQNPIRHA